jgi:DNA-binding CsgD family transcriptional regulator
MLHEILENKGLTKRQAEVAVLIAKGMSNKEAASHLFITEKAVKFHLTNIYKIMNVKGRSKLIVWCMPHMSFHVHAEQPKPATKVVIAEVDALVAIKNAKPSLPRGVY